MSDRSYVDRIVELKDEIDWLRLEREKYRAWLVRFVNEHHSGDTDPDCTCGRGLADAKKLLEERK